MARCFRIVSVQMSKYCYIPGALRTCCSSIYNLANVDDADDCVEGKMHKGTDICCNMHGSSSSGAKPTLAPFLDLCICAGHRSRDAVICMNSANLVAFFVSFFHQSLTSSLFPLELSPLSLLCFTIFAPG